MEQVRSAEEQSFFGGFPGQLAWAEAKTVEPGEEENVIPCDGETNLAAPGVAFAEREGDFSDVADTPEGQDFEEKLEAAGLEKRILNARAAHQEEAGEWIVDTNRRMLKRLCEEDGRGGEQSSEGVKSATAAAGNEAAGDCEFATVLDGVEQLGQEFGRVLAVGIENADNRRVRLAPSMQHRSGEAALVAAD